MNRYVMEEFYSDPVLRRRLFGEARLERGRAIRAGFAWLRKQLLPRFSFGRTHWMERLG